MKSGIQRELSMNKLAKLGMVICGYILSCLAAMGVVYVYELLTQNAAAQASSGMYAFGDLILLVGVFGILALLPTGLGLYFLLQLRKQ